MKLTAMILSGAMAAAAPALAHPEHGGMPVPESAPAANSTPSGTLEAYRRALTALDAEAASALFAADSHVFENGKYEGSFADYLKHHIGPELHEFQSFSFSRPTLDVEVDGNIAYGRETYAYTIVLKDGRTVERDGVATSVLRRGADGWKIVSYHGSSRAPKKAAQ